MGSERLVFGTIVQRLGLILVKDAMPVQFRLVPPREFFAPMTERLGGGLQNRIGQFKPDSVLHLHVIVVMEEN